MVFVMRRLLLPLRDADGALVAYTQIDGADARLRLYSWHRHPSGYASRRGSVFLHREVLGLRRGNPLTADHISGDRLDNRRSNLRAVTRSGNAQNLAPRAGGTSRHRGVCWDAGRGLWRAEAQVAGRRVQVGRFAAEADAAAAVSAYRLAHMPFTNEERHT